MSVFTTFLVVATCLLFYANGAPNKKADEGHPRANNRFRQNVPYQADEALFTNSVPIAITGLLPTGVVTGLATFSTSSGIPSVIGNTGSAASAGAGFPPSGLGTGLSPFPIPPGMFYGTSNTASIYGSGSSSGFVPFPTQGAPYQNFTAPYIQPSSLPSLAVPAVNIPTETGVGNSGQGDSSAQCPPPQTVTLPPQIITLPAETATVTAAPQTITQTITITPQIQTQAITITVTVTAGPAPAYSKAGDAGSPQNLPAAAPSNFPTLAASNAPAGIVPPANAGLGNGGIGTQGSGSQGASIPGIQPPAQTGGPALGSGQPAAPVHPAGTLANNNGVAMPSATGPVLGSGAAPVLPAATSAKKNGIATPTAVLPVVTSTINLVPVPSAVLPAPVNTPASPNQGQNSVASQPAPGPPPSNIPSIQSPAQITNVPGLMPSGNVPISPVTNSSILGQPPSVPPSPPPIAPYPFQNSTGPSNVRGPSGIGSIGSIPSIGPTGSGSGFAGPTSGATALFQPIRPPPQDISSIQPPPFQANASVTPPQAGPTAQVTPPVSLNSSQPLSANVTSSINLGPVHPFTGLPPKPTLQPSSPLNISAQEAPPLSTTNTDSTCSTNGISSQNITANVRLPLQPSLQATHANNYFSTTI